MINRQQAGTLYGNGFLLRDKEGRNWQLTLSADQHFVAKNELNNDKVIFYHKIPSDYKIIARKPDLTLPIIVDGKEIIPIVELAKIAFPKYKWQHDGQCFCEKEEAVFSFSKNGHFSAFRFGFEMLIHDQLSLFNWLFAHHYLIGFDESMIVWATNEYDN